jgi:hypothetical protein
MIHAKRLFIALAMIMFIGMAFAQDSSSSPTSMAPVSSEAPTSSAPTSMAPASSDAPSMAPIEASPTPAPVSGTTTSAPTGTHPDYCWTCPPGFTHYWNVAGATNKDPCGCIEDPSYVAGTTTTKAPVATPKATDQLSGNNNARSSATKTVAAGSLLLVLAVVAAL